jgi:hypothetical protein
VAATTTVEPPENMTAHGECDTNADTCCLGRNFLILHYTTRAADVYAYDKSYKPLEGVPIVAGATAYDDPSSGLTYILIFNKSLYYGTKLNHSLINPNQIRSYGIGFWDNPFDRQRGLVIDVNDELKVPLQSRGTKLQFVSRTPTQDELIQCPGIVMTSPTPWNPNDVTLNEATTSTPVGSTPAYRISHISKVGSVNHYEYTDPTSDESLLHAINPCLVNLRAHLLSRTIKQTTPKYDHDLEDVPARHTYVSTERHSKVTSDNLAERFVCIGPEHAKATLRATTQRGVRSAILPIGQRY